MSITSLVDNNFDKNITTSYFLSIQLALDGFSFCVLDPISNEYIQFYSRQLSLNENIFDILCQEIKDNPTLGYSYQKVFILYNSKQTTLVPDALFQKDKESTFLNFCFQNKNSEEHLFFNNKIRMADSYCVYSIPKRIITELHMHFSNLYFFTQTAPFIENALLNTTNDALHYHVHINIQDSFFEIIVTTGNDLIMHNNFKFKDKKEFLYFVLFVFEQLKLNTHLTNVFLSGLVSKNDEIYSLLKRYIKHVKVNSETRHFKFSGIFKNVPLQNYLNLFNIPLCV